MKRKKICIINYGMGNIHSVYNALLEIGYTPMVTNKKEVMKKADCFILPGQEPGELRREPSFRAWERHPWFNFTEIRSEKCKF